METKTINITKEGQLKAELIMLGMKYANIHEELAKTYNRIAAIKYELSNVGGK